MRDVRSVLFVCSGNSCRSVMAEGLLKKHLQTLGKEYISVASAGTIAYTGGAPTPETVMVMADEGVDVSRHRSQPLTEELIAGADLILVMEEAHRDAVLARMPEAELKTHLVREYGKEAFDAREGNGIPDPIGRPIEYYRYCLNLINKETERIAKLV